MAAIGEAGISVAISMAVAIVQGCVVVASPLAGVMPSVDSMAAGLCRGRGFHGGGGGGRR